MTVYSNGQKITAIYSNGQSVGAAYSNGQLVFSKKQGWQLGPDLRLTVNSANNNSAAGSIVFNRYDYYDGGNITESYYQVSSRELSRSTEGVVTLSLGANTAIVFGDALNSADYLVPANGEITLSASELNTLFRIKPLSGSINLGTALTVTSNYLEPVQDMGISQLGESIYVASGWAIANNRISRIKTSSAITVALSSLSVPGEGTWPVYAVAASGTEVETSTITCSVGVHQSFESQNIRHLGWVAVSGGAITNVTSINSTTGSALTKSISGSTLTVNAGYATDTDGCKVYVPRITYSFSDMISAAADKKVSEVLGNKESIIKTSKSNVTPSNGTHNMWASGSTYFDKVQTGANRFKVSVKYVNTAQYVDSYTIIYSKYTGQTFTYIPYTYKEVAYDMDHKSGGTTASRLTFYMPAQSSIYQIQSTTSGGGTSKGTSVEELYYYEVKTEASTTPGTTQKRNLYAKVTRNQNNNTKTTATQTSTGNSSPYVSYVFIGTITVTRNSSTGTIS